MSDRNDEADTVEMQFDAYVERAIKVRGELLDWLVQESEQESRFLTNNPSASISTELLINKMVELGMLTEADIDASCARFEVEEEPGMTDEEVAAMVEAGKTMVEAIVKATGGIPLKVPQSVASELHYRAVAGLNRLLQSPPLAYVHDEIIIEGPKEAVQEAIDEISKGVMGMISDGFEALAPEGSEEALLGEFMRAAKLPILTADEINELYSVAVSERLGDLKSPFYEPDE